MSVRGNHPVKIRTAIGGRMAWTIGCLFVLGLMCPVDRVVARDPGLMDNLAAPSESDGLAPLNAPAAPDQFTSSVSLAAPAAGPQTTNPSNYLAEATQDRLLNLFAHSDASFSNFISPISNPIFFEDPRTLTEAKFVFLNNQLPGSLGGKDVQVYALQLRAAITDRLSIIATKDGFIVSENPLMEDGWANLALGLKYNLYKDAAAQQLLSIGTTLQLPTGSLRTLQGNGDGEFNIFLSGGKQIGEKWHYVTATGFRLATDQSDQTDSWYWSNHIDRKLTCWGLYGLYEVNWYHWLRSAGAFPAAVDGLDLANLGGTGVAGTNVVTNAIGLKYAPSIAQEIGVAWEFPLTSRQDLMENRLNFNWSVRY